VLVRGFALMTEVETLVLAEVMKDAGHVSIQEGRDGGEDLVVAVVSASDSASVGRFCGESQEKGLHCELN
jgi:hypothetical protein